MLHHSVLVCEASLRRNYQDLQFCPQNNAEDLAESSRRSLNRLRAVMPDIQVQSAEDLDTQGIPFLQEMLLPNDFKGLSSPSLAMDARQGIVAALNMDEHLVLKAQGGPDNVNDLVKAVRALEGKVGDSRYPYAYDSRYGFLSYRPLLAGSGLHISFVMHLPMLHFLKQTRALAMSLKERGCTLKPLGIKDDRNPGRLYLLTNQGSHRMDDGQIEESALGCAATLDEKERLLQEKSLAGNSQSVLNDQVWRSFGVLSNARRLTISDFLNHWSNLRLGITSGVLPVPLDKADNLLAYANDHAFLMEGADNKTMIFRRADQVRRVLSGGQDAHLR